MTKTEINWSDISKKFSKKELPDSEVEFMGEVPADVVALYKDEALAPYAIEPGRRRRKADLADYERWLDSWIIKLIPKLKPDASVYICGDWRSSTPIHRERKSLRLVR